MIIIIFNRFFWRTFDHEQLCSDQAPIKDGIVIIHSCRACKCCLNWSFGTVNLASLTSLKRLWLTVAVSATIVCEFVFCQFRDSALGFCVGQYLLGKHCGNVPKRNFTDELILDRVIRNSLIAFVYDGRNYKKSRMEKKKCCWHAYARSIYLFEWSFTFPNKHNRMSSSHHSVFTFREWKTNFL